MLPDDILGVNGGVVFLLFLATGAVLVLLLIRAIMSYSDSGSPASTKSNIYSAITIVLVVVVLAVLFSAPYSQTVQEFILSWL